MTFFTLFFEALLVLWSLILIRREGFCFTTIFLLVFVGLDVLPIVLLLIHQVGFIDLNILLMERVNSAVVLRFGEGIRPALMATGFHFFFLLGHSVSKNIEWGLHSRRLKQFLRTLTLKEDRPFPLYYSILLFAFIILYTGLRWVYTKDFPVLAWLTDSSLRNIELRDLSFKYSTVIDIFYLFKPSINSQVYRVLLPAVALLFYSELRKSPSGSSQKRTITVLFWSAVFLVAVLNFGTFKRSPVFYVAAWFFLYFFMYSKRNIMKYIFFGTVLTFVIFAAITYLYNTPSPIQALSKRFVIGESLGSMLALEYFGSVFDYRGLTHFTQYLTRVVGLNTESFSQHWKILTTGGTGKGFTSIGIFTEMFVCFGACAAFAASYFMGLILGTLDKLKSFWMLKTVRPFAAGMMIVVGFMAVKGFLSQFFTGGVLTLLVVFLLLHWKIIFESCQKLRS